MKFLRFLSVLIVLIIGFGVFRYFNKNIVLQHKDFTIKNGNIYQTNNNKDIIIVNSSEISSITKYYVLSETILVESYVGQRGAGKEYDYWIVSLATLDKTNLSKTIRTYQSFKDKYSNEITKNLFLGLYSNPEVDKKLVFIVMNGWEVLDGQWEFDYIKTGEFKLIK